MNILYSRSASDARSARPLLLIHGGAGPRSTELALQTEKDYRRGLLAALEAGRHVLEGGQSALDGVCAAVVALEDNPLFNAGCGASLTECGSAEMDAAVMTGDGQAGAVAVSRYARNPVLAARAVMEQTDHVLMVGPGIDLVDRWGLRREPTSYFVTDHRLRQLDSVLAQRQKAARHGTVGAVAIDAAGAVACATSTGGMVGQSVGRVGDTGLIGAGSFAGWDTAAISCTGEGEAFIKGVVAHDIASRIRHGGASLHDAVHATYERELDGRGATGGSIALTPDGQALIAHNSKAMFAGYWDGERTEAFV